MSITFGYHPLAVAFALALSGLLTWWTYRRTIPQVAPPLRRTLVALRFSGLAIILVLLSEPLVRALQTQLRPPILAVLVDASESMSLRETGLGVDVASEARSALDQLGLGSGEVDLRTYTFDSDLHAIDPEAPFDPDSLRFSGGRTDVSRALDRLAERHREDNLRGVLLISDGRYNTGRNPLYVADGYPVPIHTVVVGDTTSRRDVQVRRLTTNDIAYVGVELPVEAGLRAQGFENEIASVTLFLDNVRLTSTTVALPAGTAEIPVEMTVVPDAPGLHRLTVAVSRFDGEITYANNVESVSVQVLESRQKALLVAAGASPDVASLLQILALDANLETVVRTERSPGVFYEGPLPDDLGSFDVVILAGYPGSAADRASGARLAEAITAGVPALFVLGRGTDIAVLSNLFGEWLPAQPVAIRRGFLEASLEVTPEGALHPVLEVSGLPPDAWRVLPPLAYNESLWQATPDARVLATTRVRGVRLNDPLIAVRRRSGLRSAVVLGAGTWRWANVPEDLEAARPFWPGVVENLLRWLTARADDRPVRIKPTRTLYAGGESVEFTGQVYDESLRPVSDATVSLDLTAPDGGSFSYALEPIGSGRYVLEIGALPEGSYQYRGRAEREASELGSDSGVFAVGALTLEFKETQADAPLMRQIARRSGGLALLASDLPSLESRLHGSSSFEAVSVETERTLELWRVSWFLALLVILFSVEWALRKRNGMV